MVFKKQLNSKTGVISFYSELNPVSQHVERVFLYDCVGEEVEDGEVKESYSLVKNKQSRTEDSKAWPIGISENHLQLDPYTQKRGNLNMNGPTCGHKYSLRFQAIP